MPVSASLRALCAVCARAHPASALTPPSVRAGYSRNRLLCLLSAATPFCIRCQIDRDQVGFAEGFKVHFKLPVQLPLEITRRMLTFTSRDIEPMTARSGTARILIHRLGDADLQHFQVGPGSVRTCHIWLRSHAFLSISDFHVRSVHTPLYQVRRARRPGPGANVYHAGLVEIRQWSM